MSKIVEGLPAIVISRKTTSRVKLAKAHA